MINFFSRAILMSTPLLIGSLAEVISERSGVMLCAIEGIFLMGAWGGFVGTYLTHSAFAGLLFAILCGSALAALYGYVCVFKRQQQVVTGTALNILALGFCAFFQRVIFGIPLSPLVIDILPKIRIPLLWRIPFLGPVLFSQNILTYFSALLCVAVYFVLYRTSVGLNIRSCGENPEAVDVSGISVEKYRFFTCLAAGVLSSVAGYFYTVGYVGIFTTNIIGGRGWIAFAICFLGNWEPIGALLGTLAFGFSDALSVYIQSANLSNAFPREIVIALPYLLTIMLTVMRSRLRIPEVLGVPYHKES